MTLTISPREHVIVSYAILLVILVSLAILGLREPVAKRASFFSELRNLRAVYARSIEVIQDSSATQATLRGSEDRGARDFDFLHADTDDLAAADLQNKIKTLIEAENGTLVSSAFQRTNEPLPVTPVTVVVRFRCSVAALARILYALENQSPPLLTEDLSIQSRHRPGRPLEDVNDELDVELNVTGYLKRALVP